MALDVLENGARILSCVGCDGRVEPLLEPGGTGTVRQHLWQVLQVPVSWFTVLLGPLTVWAIWKARGAMLFAVAPCFWSLYFATVRSAARAFDLVKGSERLDLLDHVVFPAGKAVVVTAVAAGPVTLIRWITGDFAAPASNPLLWALVALGALAMPLWTAYLAGGAGLREALAPSRALGSIRELGADYWTVAGWTLVTSALCFLWAGGANKAIRGPAFVLLQGLAVYAFLFVARFAGALLAIRGPDLGFALRPDQLRPVLPGAVPRGTRKARPPPPAPRVIAPIELEERAPEGPMEVERGMGGGGRWGGGEGDA